MPRSSMLPLNEHFSVIRESSMARWKICRRRCPSLICPGKQYRQMWMQKGKFTLQNVDFLIHFINNPYETWIYMNLFLFCYFEGLYDAEDHKHWVLTALLLVTCQGHEVSDRRYQRFPATVGTYRSRPRAQWSKSMSIPRYWTSFTYTCTGK